MFTVRFTHEAREDIIRLYGFLLEKDLNVAEEAVNAIEKGISFLREFPFSCRKADSQNPFLRELLISFGNSGYVALFEIENSHTITVLAVRHQREDDYL
jgi:plasmid stabilization system protein ParE